MTCTNCNRANLPGGLRCAYCGTYLPQALEFDLGNTTENATKTVESVPATPPEQTPKLVKAAGIFAPLVVLALKAKSLLTLLKLGKIITTLGSMLLFIWVDAQIFGWRFGVGIAISILIHELGHVFVNWRYRLPQSAPVFIPFVGAAIFLKKFPDNPQIQAESGAGGPVAGFLAALGCVGIYFLTHDPFWLALAHVGFAINLFNLIPFPPLDGSHIHTVFSPGIWNVVLATMLLWAIKVPSGTLWMILVVSILMRLSYKDDGRYLMAPPHVRVRMAVLYVLLCLTMSWASDQTMAARPEAENRPGIHTLTLERSNDRFHRPDIARTSENNDQVFDMQDVTESNSDVRRVVRSTVFQVMQAVMSLLSLLFWPAVVALLVRSQNRKWTSADGRYIAGMASGIAIVELATLLLLPGAAARWSMTGACFAGTLLALGFASVCAIQRFKKQATIPTPVALRMRASAAMALGVFLVGYATLNPAVIVVLAAGILVFYLQHRWMIPATLGQLAMQFGDTEKASDHFTEAAMACADMEEKAHLWNKVVGLNLSLDRGSAALSAQMEKDRLHLDSAAAPAAFIAEFANHVSALGLTGQFEEGLAACERVLRRAGQDPRRAGMLVPLAEAFVHIALARFALFRGWHDEAVVQADWCLKRLAPSAISLRACLHTLRADALLAQAEQVRDGDRRAPLLAQAKASCDAAETLSHETGIRAYMATLRARIAAIEGDDLAARQSAKRARDLLPAHLGCRYWYGRLVEPEMLARLAAEFPNDYWGHLAARR